MDSLSDRRKVLSALLFKMGQTCDHGLDIVLIAK